MDTRQAVMILDDDPSHLRIYGWIVESAGYRQLPVLVQIKGVELGDDAADLVLLDYHLAGQIRAADVALQVRQHMPQARILVLSDALVLPEDMEPLVDGFVRKGDPSKLVEVLKQHLQ